MLTEHPIDVMLTATDLGTTKRFYGDRVGLDVFIESDVAAEVAELRAHGVDVVVYDDPGLKTVDGVTDVGFAPRRGSSTRVEPRSDCCSSMTSNWDERRRSTRRRLRRTSSAICSNRSATTPSPNPCR